MNRSIVFAAVVAFVTSAMLAPVAQAGGYYPKTLTVAAGATNNLAYIDLATTVAGCQEIDRVVVKHITGAATGTVYFASFDLVTGTALFNTAALVLGDVSNTHPKYSYLAQTTSGYVVTNAINFFVAGTTSVLTGDVMNARVITTNYYPTAVMVPVSNTQTNYEAYSVRTLKLNVIQGVSPTADTYGVEVFTK